MQDFLICRVCLATNVKMYHIHSYNLNHYYDLVAGNGASTDNLPLYVCYLCSSYLNKFYIFHNKCHKAREILTEAFLHFKKVPVDFIEHINTKSSLLGENFTVIESTVDIFLDDTEKANIKYEISEPEIENKDDFSSQNSYSDMKVDSPDIYKEEYQNNSSPNSLRSEDEPLILRVSKTKTKNREPCGKKDLKKETKKSGKRKFNESFAEIIILSKDQQLKEVENRKSSPNYLNSPYKCDKCYKGFLEDVSFKNHMVRHNKNSGDFECEICQIRCETERKLRSHRISAHERKYACRECGHISNTCNQAREHEKWHKGCTYACEICGQEFRKSTTRLTHVRLCHPTEHVCNICGDSFIGPLGVAMHKKRAHKDCLDESTIVESYCADCNLQFLSKKALERHVTVSAKHSGDNQFSHNCKTCGNAYESEQVLFVHSKTHSSTPEGEEKAKCKQCGAQFTNAKKCAAHHRRVHLGFKYAAKTIVCEICGKKCTSNATLQYHQRTHTGEKPYQCNLCPKRFSIRQRLQIHSRTHTGERPYPCPHCPKAFRHKPALNRHSRVHTGAKPYTCSYCKKSFSQSNSMKLHIHTVHFKLPAPYRNRKVKGE